MSQKFSKIVGEITKNLIRIRGRSFLKEFVCNKVVDFQASILLKVKHTTFTFQGFFNSLGAPFSKYVLI